MSRDQRPSSGPPDGAQPPGRGPHDQAGYRDGFGRPYDDDTTILPPARPGARGGWDRLQAPGGQPDPGRDRGPDPRHAPGPRREAAYPPVAPYGYGGYGPGADGHGGYGSPLGDDPSGARYGHPGGRQGPTGYGPIGGGYPPNPTRAQPRRPAPPPRRRRSGRVAFARTLSGVVSVALLSLTGFAYSIAGGTPHNPSDATSLAGDVGVSTIQTTDAAGNVVSVPTRGMNILIVGSDARTDAEGKELSAAELRALSTQWSGGGVSTDTLMIVHVPGNGAKATAISVPRDTWIDASVTNAPGVVGPYSDGTSGPYKANKINSFYGSAMTYEREYLVAQGVSDEAELQRRSAEAGRTMLIKVLQQFTGIKIDHYAEVNLIGFYLLSDAIGGVPVCLLKPVKDRQSGADFPAGPFDVSGSQALSFVRQRHGLPNGDLDRIRRQQVFLASAADKILSASTLTSPTKLRALVEAANRSLVLDNGFDLLSFAQQMMNLSSGNITFTTIPTHGNEMMDGKSALAVHPAEVRAFFANLMTDSQSSSAAPKPTAVRPASWTVDVQNGTETPGMAAQSGAVAAAAGFVRGQLSDYPGVTADNQQQATTVRYPSGGEAAAARVVSVLGVGSAVADPEIAAGHLLVVVGTDMPVIPADKLPSAPEPPASAPATASVTTMPSDAINAASVQCVN